MRLKIKWIYTLLLVMVMQFSFAQEKTVSGVVTDGSGPVPGANVIVKGTKNGVQTDFDGKYAIKAKVGDVLLVSFVGMQDASVKVGASNTVNIKLQGGNTLDEVVVVGYGTQKKRDVNGAISKISGAAIKDIPVQSFDQALSGAASGVNISQPNGVLGNQAVIRVRGVNSISLSSYPLIVIDGVPSWNGGNLNQNNAANNPLANINQADIESIEVLKDASSAAIYGSRAAAGVILITTKKGKAGRISVNFDTSVSFTKPFNLIDVLDAQQFTDIKNIGLKNAGTPANGTSVGFYTMNDANGKLVDTNWYDLIYRTGVATNHNMSISGGNENTKYFLSAGQLEQEGMFRNNDFRRQTARFTLDQKITSWFTLGGTFNYTNSRNNGLSTGSTFGNNFASSGAARLAFGQSPNVGPFNNDGTYNLRSNVAIGNGNNKTNLTFVNPQYVLDTNTFTAQNDHFISNFYIGLKLAKGLNFKSLYGIDNLLVENKDFLGPLNGDGASLSGAATNTMNRYSRKSIQNVLDYSIKLSEKHFLSALAGSEKQYSKVDAWGASRRGVSDPFFNEYQGGYSTIVSTGNLLTENYLDSYFGRVNYDFNKKYFLSANARRDGFSAFAPKNKWGNFWGGSLGWAVTEESFFKKLVNPEIINQFKVRASYGVVGNNQGLSDFAASSFFDAGVNGTNTTLFFNSAGNENLKWETSNKTDFGLNFGLFNDRIIGELGYYKNDIDGLILSVPQAASVGIPGNSILANVGSMRNTGYEITLSAKIIDNNNFKWNSSFNITTQKNVVTALDEKNSDIIVATQLESANIIRVGESIGDFYIVKTGGVNPENGRRIFFHGDGTAVQYDHSNPVTANRWTKVSDGTPTRAANQAQDAKVMGPALPKFFGGLNNTFTYKGFDLNVNVYFSGGNYVYNGTRAGLLDQRLWNNTTEVLTHWKSPGDVTTVPRLVHGDNVSNGSTIPISDNLEKGDFIKVRNIVLGYNLPQNLLEKLKLSSFRFYLSAQNAFTITSYSGFDPEISSNGNANGAPSVDRNSAPMARTFSLGLNLGL